MNDSELLATAREYALELLIAIDETQIIHQPRPHAEIVQMLRDLLDVVDGTDGNPQARFYAILKDPANDDDHPGGEAA